MSSSNVTSSNRSRHDELVALLTEIRDRLPEPEGVNSVEDGPTDITEEPPVGSQVTGCMGDIWERREEGWVLWWSERSAWLADLHGGGGLDPWSVVRAQDPLRFTTDEDRRRVGLRRDADREHWLTSTPEEREHAASERTAAPADVDPDEALADLIGKTLWPDDPEWSHRGTEARQRLRETARAAREHIGHEVQMGNARLLADMRVHAERERRCREEAEADLADMTRQRDAMGRMADHNHDVAAKVKADRDEWKVRHKALREDVGAHRDAWRQRYTGVGDTYRWSSFVIARAAEDFGDILDRDSKWGEQA